MRINPNEVHFNDPDFIDMLYPTGGRKTDKPLIVGGRLGSRHRNAPKISSKANSPLSPAPNSIIATVSHDVHRMRRNSINGFFSNASIRRVEPIIKENWEKMLSRWGESSSKDAKVLHLHTIFKAYTSDIITTYAFGDCFQRLGQGVFRFNGKIFWPHPHFRPLSYSHEAGQQRTNMGSPTIHSQFVRNVGKENGKSSHIYFITHFDFSVCFFD